MFTYILVIHVLQEKIQVITAQNIVKMKIYLNADDIFFGEIR